MYNFFKRILRRLFSYIWLNVDAITYARSIGVNIGNDCRIINPELETFGSEPYLIRIGDHVTLSSGVRLVTHDGGVWVFRNQNKNIEKFGPIIIGNNVFVGTNSIILPGVRIGDSCVIGAGSIVTKDIPPNSVVAGVPARKIKSISQYWESASSQFTYIRYLSSVQKRRLLVDRFNDAINLQKEN